MTVGAIIAEADLAHPMIGSRSSKTLSPRSPLSREKTSWMRENSATGWAETRTGQSMGLRYSASRTNTRNSRFGGSAEQWGLELR